MMNDPQRSAPVPDPIGAGTRSATCSQKKEQGFPISMQRMVGLDTAARFLGGKDALAGALGISVRGVGYKIAAGRGISDDDLRSAADALDRHARVVVAHAAKLRGLCAGEGR